MWYLHIPLFSNGECPSKYSSLQGIVGSGDMLSCEEKVRGYPLPHSIGKAKKNDARYYHDMFLCPCYYSVPLVFTYLPLQVKSGFVAVPYLCWAGVKSIFCHKLSILGKPVGYVGSRDFSVLFV